MFKKEDDFIFLCQISRCSTVGLGSYAPKDSDKYTTWQFAVCCLQQQSSKNRLIDSRRI